MSLDSIFSITSSLFFSKVHNLVQPIMDYSVMSLSEKKKIDSLIKQ